MMEEEKESALYEPLDSKKKFNVDSEHNKSGCTIPSDTKNFVYMSLLACGVGFVLPYSSFIVAADYWQERFRGKSVALDMSLTYILSAFSTVIVNNLILSWIPFKWRVMFGYVVSLITLAFITMCEVAFHVFSKATAYSVCLAAVSLVALGCTVQQSSFYGFSSIFPKQYTQAVMAGESVAGLLVSTNRIFTKSIISNDRISTVIFFLTSIIYIGFSLILHIISMKTAFVQYYLQQCSKIVFKVNVGATEENQYNVDAMSADIQVPSMSFCNPLYEPTLNHEQLSEIQVNDIPNVQFKMESDMSASQRFSGFKSGIMSRWKVARAIYPYMVSIIIAYCVTLSLYPGIESEIISCKFHSWMPVLLMFTFNAGDVLGKVLAAVPYTWSRRQLVLLSSLRIIIVPLLLLCCAPRKSPVINGEVTAFIFTAAFGLTNGVAGSLPMMLAPSKVPATLKEIAGNMMTLSYNIGLVIGAVIGYIFDNILGEQITDINLVCPSYPYAPHKNQVLHGPPIPHTHFGITSTLSTIATTFFSTTTEPFDATTSSISLLSTILNNKSYDGKTTLGVDAHTNYTEIIFLSTTEP